MQRLVAYSSCSKVYTSVIVLYRVEVAVQACEDCLAGVLSCCLSSRLPFLKLSSGENVLALATI
jgi:hypothetical protein